MSQVRSVGFWSYTRRDDDLEGGRILRLAGKIQNEYELITGEELKLFIDKKSVEWGEEWKRVTDTALTETVFFIPIITPKYLQSEECRREFIEFVGRAASVDARDLVLPILYIDTPAVNDVDTADEVARLVRDTQQSDWRTLRLTSEESEAYRTAINLLAQRLADITREMADRPLPELAEEQQDDKNEQLDDIAEAEIALERWSKILQELGEATQDLQPLLEKTTEQITESDRRGRGARGRIQVLARFAGELKGPSDRLFELGTEFGRTAVDANPGVIAAISMAKTARQNPAEAADAEEFIATVRGLVEMSEDIATALRQLLSNMEDAESVSRVVRSPVRRMRSGLAAMLDALTVLDGWIQLADE
ncbi:TIR domain-containing protein [Actinoplanes utahensis]|uniref:TIR domain-containing protein n=1 Tax=Actinoplanes utahensis TaxID=1869 RepID=UPI00137870C2|nr:TIR domain-containing protein [Actinoplanes utahensis]GIF29673.1 hypothetical protein Aut01nite_26590 [Actinoplanes utahensis]